ncbi:MAG: carbohydrate ABC transporter permease [Lentisphaerae bacterium]|nr:carbohydrate ABC transporter permease [Lentisphaerota bacterium]
MTHLLRRRFPGRLLALTLLGTLISIPFFWMISISFKPRAEAESPDVLPVVATAQNYPIVLDARPDPATNRYLGMRYGRWYYNTFFIALGVTLLQVLTSSMAAYAFSRIQWRGRDQVFMLYLATMMIPGVVTMIPNFQIMVWLGFVNTYHGLIIPAAFSTFGTFLLRQFMLSIPPSLDEAAQIDGASHWHIFWEIILPLARPGLIALAILTFIGSYQSFFWPLVMLNSEDLFPISIGLLTLDSSYGTQTEMIMAAATMAVAPLIIVFVIFQKFLVKGLQMGGVKG